MRAKLKCLALLLFILAFSSCSKVDLPETKYVQIKQIDKTKDFRMQLPTYPVGKIEYQETANKKKVEIKKGDKNLYGVKITKDLKKVYDGYLSGDGEQALESIVEIEKKSKDPLMLWQVSFLKVQVLMMMGLGDDALEEIKTCSRYEREVFNSDLNSIALRAELNVWLENYDEAETDAKSVLLTIAPWEFPTKYSTPPKNMADLVATTTAQLRAYATLAALYNLKEDYEESYYWANEAEKRMNAVFYVSNHKLYGKFVNLTVDAYYGRATNLTFLGAAKLALGYDESEVDEEFNKAIEFFDLLDYRKGKATVLAFKARTYNRTGRYDKCYEAGKKALDYCVENGFLDFVWRIEVIRGDTFSKLGMPNEAEKSFRRAEETINILSGALSSDSGKKNFGIDKEDITFNVIKFDLERNDYSQLFRDIENSKARRTIDMLDIDVIANKKSDAILKEIQLLDKDIRKQKLFNTGPGEQKKGIKKLEKLFEERKKMEKKLQKKDSKLASVISVWSNSLEEVQKHLDKNEAMIYFLPIREAERIQYLKIKQEEVKLETLPVTSKELKEYLRDLSKELGLDTVTIMTKDSTKNFKNLHDIVNLLKEGLNINTMFEADKTYIVSNGIIDFVPWGMLEMYREFTIIPNGSWLAYEGAEVKSGKDILIVGDEKKNTIKIKGAKIITGKDANEKNIRKRVDNGIKILHFTVRSTEESKNSFIFLNENELLKAEEILKEPLPAELVILDNHNVKLDKLIGYNKLTGLKGAFYLGGTKAILSSLWFVEDEAKEKFMEEFYEYAKKGEYSKGYLRARNLLKDKGYSPAIYGAFILEGVDEK